MFNSYPIQEKIIEVTNPEYSIIREYYLDFISNELLIILVGIIIIYLIVEIIFYLFKKEIKHNIFASLYIFQSYIITNIFFILRFFITLDMNITKYYFYYQIIFAGLIIFYVVNRNLHFKLLKKIKEFKLND